MPFELFLALRYLRPKRTFVSVITLISIIGVMLGVAVLMIVIAVMSGFDREWRDKILSADAHLKVVTYGGLMRDYQSPMSVAATNPLVRGVAPFVVGQVMLETQPWDTNEQPLISGPVLRGIDPAQEAQVSCLTTSIVRGEFDVSGHGIIVGNTLAHELQLTVGDHVAVLSPSTLAQWRKAQSKQDEAVLPDDFTVRGIFSVGFDDFDRMMIVSSLETAQDLYNLNGHVHGLNVMLRDPFKVEEARRSLLASLGPNFRVKIWTEENDMIFGALATEKTMMYIILFVVMIVAAFAIVNSEITFAVNKMKEIGLLKSLGASNRQVMWIFLGHSIAIGMLGVGLGFGLGMLFLKNLNNILHGARSLTGFELLPAAIYKISEIPYELLPLDVGIICGGSFLICVLAGLLPAWQASRLQPVEALRNE
jgi:lipoprotein-releasing system permease protein